MLALWANQKLRKKEREQALGGKGCREGRKRRDFPQAALENSSIPTGPKKKGVGVIQDLHPNVQMPSRIGQFSSQLTSHGTVAKDQFAEDEKFVKLIDCPLMDM